MKKLGANYLFLVVLFSLCIVLADFAAADTVIKIGQDSDIMSFDPHSQNDIGSASVIRHIYDTLLRADHNNNINPCLPESWQNSVDSHNNT